MEYSGRSNLGSAAAGGCRRHHLFAHARNRHTQVSGAEGLPLQCDRIGILSLLYLAIHAAWLTKSIRGRIHQGPILKGQDS